MIARSPRSSETRDRLLQAAAALTAEVGWSAVTTRMVAKRAGLAPGLVHYHFASLDDLLRTAALQSLESMFAQPMQQLQSAGRPADGLRHMAEELTGWQAGDGSFVLMAELMLAAVRQPAIQTDLAMMLAEYRVMIARWLAGHGVTEAEVLAALIVAALDGAMMHRLVDPALDVRTVIEPLAALLEQRT